MLRNGLHPRPADQFGAAKHIAAHMGGLVRRDRPVKLSVVDGLLGRAVAVRVRLLAGGDDERSDAAL